jgi:hypothetical protein
MNIPPIHCFLCGARRRGSDALAEHLVFWHSAPRKDALIAAAQIAQGKPVCVNTASGTEPAFWEQLLLPTPGMEVRSSRGHKPRDQT